MSGHLVNYKSANPRNLKMIASSKEKSPEQQIYPNNKAYLEPSPIQSQVKELNRDRMIEQNKKMKKHVLELAEQMGKMVAKGHQKKKYGINFDELLGQHS